MTTFWLVIGAEKHNYGVQTQAWRFASRTDAKLWAEARAIIEEKLRRECAGMDSDYDTNPSFTVIGPVNEGVHVDGKTVALEDGLNDEFWSEWEEAVDASGWRAVCQAVVQAQMAEVSA